jgi:CRP-like cAMP-binding protein
MFLDSFEARHREAFRHAGSLLSLPTGYVLVSKGEPSDALYYVEDGTLEVMNAAGARLCLANAGEVVGEVGFLDGAARSADVRAWTRSVVRRWSRDAMTGLLVEHPELERDFYDALVRVQSLRLRQLTDGDSERTALQVPLAVGVFYPERAMIRREDGPVHLSRLERDLLAYLCAHPRVSLSYRVLLTKVWGYNQGVTSRTVYSTIHRLRAKVEPDPTQPRHIVAIPGVGYRFDP